MFKSSARSIKILGAFAMVIALISAGLFIVKQCQPTAAVISLSHSTDHSVTPTTGVLTETWFNDICLGIIFFALLAGTRFRLGFNPNSKFQLTQIFWRRVSTFTTMFNLNLTLTRPQLGVFRI